MGGNKTKIKEFFKPTRRKIILTFLIGIFPLVFFFLVGGIEGRCWGDIVYMPTVIFCTLIAYLWITMYFPIYLVALLGGELMGLTLGLLLNLLCFYIFSCIIFFLYNKYNRKIK